MKIREIMDQQARCVGLENSVVEAAGVMRLFDVGAVPVCDDDQVVGMLTDHDIVVRSVADGRDLNHITVREALSGQVAPVFEDEEIEEAARLMEEQHLRRLPVLDQELHLVGTVSLRAIVDLAHIDLSARE